MNVKEVERLIKISKEHPLMPETYIPWQLEPQPGDIFLPETLTSLQGLEIYDTINLNLLVFITNLYWYLHL